MQIFSGGFEIFVSYYKKKKDKIKWNNELNISQENFPKKTIASHLYFRTLYHFACIENFSESLCVSEIFRGKCHREKLIHTISWSCKSFRAFLLPVMYSMDL